MDTKSSKFKILICTILVLIIIAVIIVVVMMSRKESSNIDNSNSNINSEINDGGIRPAEDETPDDMQNRETEEI